YSDDRVRRDLHLHQSLSAQRRASAAALHDGAERRRLQAQVMPLAHVCLPSGNGLYFLYGYSCPWYSRYVRSRSKNSAGPTPESFLPLPRDTFHILVSLADRDRHGYSVMKDVFERTDGALRLSPSSLYASIRRLLEKELIEELA